MKKITRILLILVMVLLPFALPVATMAAVSPTLAPVDAETNINLRPAEYKSIVNMQFPTLLSGLVKLVLVVAALVFFFVLVIGGIQWILSGGDKAGAETARKRITAALVGLAIVFVAWAIGSLINVLFGIDIFNLDIPTLYNP
jgi:hypothetical protein